MFTSLAEIVEKSKLENKPVSELMMVLHVLQLKN